MYTNSIYVLIQLLVIDSNGPLENGSLSTPSYTKGIDQDTALVSNAATISLSSPSNIQYMSVVIANSLDGSSEMIVFDDNFQPSIPYQYTRPPSDSHSSVLIIEGTAAPSIYTEILRNLRYVNNEGRPTTGERIVYMVVSDGGFTNDITLSYATIDVLIHNTAPVLSVSGTDDSFRVLYFPFEGLVPAVDRINTYVIDTDSDGIQSTTMQLVNVKDEENEILSVTYVSPEQLSLPVIAEAVNLDMPFGVLWDGEELPSISSVIMINADPTATVGEVSILVDVKHSWVGDLTIELEHNSLRKLLVLNPGGQTCQMDDLFLTTFSSYYNSQIDPPYLSRTVDSPGVCVLRSQGVFTTDGEIDFFHGMSIGGEWVLHVTDGVLDEYSGRLVGWSLTIQPMEAHLVSSYPPVLPPLSVNRGTVYGERHVKHITSDGRIVKMAVHVHLGVPYTAEFAFLPSLTLIHPDGTEIILSHGINNLCARGNYTHLIFDDRAQPTDYSCYTLLQSQTSGSGSGILFSGGSSMESAFDDSFSGFSSGSVSGSGSGSGSGNGLGYFLTPEDSITFDDAAMNITNFPTKWSLVDLLLPTTPLHRLTRKQIEGDWTLVISSEYELESTLFDWSLKISREPNIDAFYDHSLNLLTLSGSDSSANYQNVLRSVVYENIATDYEFLTTRVLTTTVFDGYLLSNATANSSKSYIGIHHIVLDLDPLRLSSSSAPDFSVDFIEHSASIAIVDPQRAIVADETFPVGEYTLTITLNDYQNHNEENVTVNLSLLSALQVHYEAESLSGQFVVTITSVNSTLQPIEIFQSVLRTAEYHNFAEEFDGSSRTVEFIVTDSASGSRFTSRIATAYITLNATNDLPVLLLNPYQYGPGSVISNVVEYIEGEGSIFLANSSSISLTDNDHNTLERVTITIDNAQDGEMEILYADTSDTNIVSTYNSTSNVLVLSGTDSLKNYEMVIGTVMYNNTFHSPGQPGTDPRYISFVPDDGTHEGQPAIAMVTFSAVNDAPFGDLNGPGSGINHTATFTEGQGPTNITSSSLMLFDVDNKTLDYVSIQITNSFDGPLESLSVMDVVEQTDPKAKSVVITYVRPETFYDDSTSTLIITGLESVREYQEVLKTLTYDNIADEPYPEARMIKVILSDGKTESEPMFISVDIELVNDSPYFDLSQPPFEPEIMEDVPLEENYGFSVADLAYLIIDDDVGATKGIALVELDRLNGRWQFTMDDGATWQNVSQNYSLLLEAVDEQRVRFIPDRNFNGIVDIVIVAWDGSDDTSAAGSYANSLSQSNIDPFSSTSLLIQLHVIPVNDAPVLLNKNLNATSLSEDDYNSTGDTVLSLLINARDIDFNTELGIAVTAADQDNGVWQYTTDGGQNWEWFGSVEVGSALLLRSYPEDENRVRFVPNLNFNGYVSLDFVAWDLTRLPEGEMYASGYMSGEILMTSSLGSSSGSLSSASGSASGNSYEQSGSGGIFDLPNVTLPEPYPVGSYVNTSISDPVTGPFSVNSVTLTLFVEPDNDSPVIQSGMTLDPIIEDINEDMNHGTQISRIMRDDFCEDVDVTSCTGLAVVEVDNRFGVWQYTCDSPPSPTSWQPFIGDVEYNVIVPPLPLQEKATLLLSSCWIRYLPSANFNNELNTDGYPRPEGDAPYIKAFGWDNTGRTFNRSGTYGNDATYAAESITNEYSMNSEQIFINVTSMNDRPVLGLTNATVTSYAVEFLEDQYPVDITGEGLSLVDVDHARLRDITVTIYGSVYDELPESILANVDFSVPVSGDYSSSVSGSSSASGYSQSGSTSGSGSGYSSGFDLDDTNKRIYPPFIPMVTSAPFRPPLHRVREFVKNLSTSTELERYCAGLETRREELFIDVSKWDLDYTILSWCPFTLYIYADPRYGDDAPKEQFRLALRTLQYNNSLDEPQGGDRTICFIVSDNHDLSAVVNATVTVTNINDSPVLNLNDNISSFNNYVSYTEGQGPLLLANESLRLVDTDDDYIQSAHIRLKDAPNEDLEVLSADTSNTNILADYNIDTSELTLTGNDTVKTYEKVLATVTYSNTYAFPGNPSTIERKVYFIVSDGKTDSDPAIAYISFTAINDLPHLYVGGPQNYTVTFTEEKGPESVVDSDLMLIDVDNSSVAFVTAQILNNEEGTEEFLLAENNPFDMIDPDDNNAIIRTFFPPNIIMYDAETATLTISGLDRIEEYEHVLRTIQYNNLADEPNNITRIIEFIANDGLLDSEPVYTEVKIAPENDSPRFNDSENIPIHMILEDDVDNVGISVFRLAYSLIEDDDENDERGIAIIAVDTENGRWEFSTDSGNATIDNYTDITSAVLLRANKDNFIRFVPEKNFNGNASLTFLPWDATDGLPDGCIMVAISQSDFDAFGEETMMFVVQVIPVNDAPVLHIPLIEPKMTPIPEDDVLEHESDGDEISIFLSALSHDVDVAEAHFGIAIVGVDNTNGKWEISVNGGVNWTDIGSPSLTSVVVMHSQPEGVNRVRFFPEKNYVGQSSFEYLLWDMDTPWPSGSGQGIDASIQDPITGTFSILSTTAYIEIEPVNDSPTLIENGGLKFSTITEDEDPSQNFGTMVDVILRDHFEDIDGLGRGVAVVHVDERNGRWWYTCQTGTDREWNEFIGGYINYETQEGTVSQISPLKPNEFAATLLDEECSIRFIPDAHFNTEYNLDGSRRDSDDIPYITIRGWDQTQGLSMDRTVNTSTIPDNHTNAFSKEIFQVTIQVDHDLDAPVLRLDGTRNNNYEATFVEPVPPEREIIPVPIVNTMDLSLTDSDNASLSFATISFTQLDPGSESILVNVSGTNLIDRLDPVLDNVYSVTILPAGGATSAPIEDFQTVLQTLRYQNIAEEPTNDEDRLIRFFVFDGLTGSAIRVTTLKTELTNDPPELDLNTGYSGTFSIVGYSEGEGPASLLHTSSVTLIDYDNTTLLDHARVNITNPYDMTHEMLAVNHTSPIIITTFNGSLLILQGPASVEEFRTAIASITYENTYSEPGDPSDLNRTIEFVVNDGIDDSISAFVYLLFTVVNNAPFLDLNGGTAGNNNYITLFYEEQYPVSAVSQSLTIHDIDNDTLAFIEVRIMNPKDGGDLELLWVDDVTVEIEPQGESKHLTYVTYSPIQYYNETTATLTFTGLETVQEFQEVLKTLTYNNLADEPDPETRELHITVSDGLLDVTAISFVEIVNINDSPFFNDSALLFTADIAEDVHDFHNEGWAVVDIVTGLILDDDADSMKGIAIIDADSNGHWEITWDYSRMNGSVYVSGSSSGSIEPGSGDLEPSSASGSGLQPLGSDGIVAASGSSGNSTTYGDMDYMLSGSGSGIGESGSTGSTSGSGLFGSGIPFLSGSGSGSGIEPEPEPTEQPGPKCIPTSRTSESLGEPTFSATWHQLPTNTSISQAVLLSSNGQKNRIRFVPNRNFNGKVSFTIKAWDTTDDGTVTDALSVSKIDSFSSETITFDITVLPVNDAPLLPNNTILALSSILEDDILSTGDDVSQLIGIISDVDMIDTSFGIAIVEADENNGRWEVSTDGGISWNTVVDVCPYNATVLSSEPSGENRVRFVPNRDFNGVTSFIFLAWDLTNGLQTGSMQVDTTVADIVTGPYSVASATVMVTVEPVNDSPVLSPGSHLQAIPEDIPVSENNGTLVADIVRGYYKDVDVNAEIGLAVVGIDLRYGIWQYWCPNLNWETFIGNLLYGIYVIPPYPQVDRATVLSGECRIRFLPNENFNTLRDINGHIRPASDVPYITIRAWDNTGLSQGLSGQYGVDTTYNNDSITNELSSETEFATVEVVSVNDISVIRIASGGDGLDLMVSYTENQAFVRLVEPHAVTLTDIDHAELESVTVTVTNTIDGAAEIIQLELSNASAVPLVLDENTNTIYVTINGSTEVVSLSYNTFSYGTSSLTLSAPIGGEKVSIEAYEELLRHVVYTNTLEEPSNDTRIIRFYINDSEDVNSLAETVIHVELLNEYAPIVNDSLTTIVFAEDTPHPIAIASDELIVTDIDHNEYFYIKNASIAIIPTPEAGNESVSVDLSNLQSQFSLTQDYDILTGVLKIIGDAPPMVYQSVLQTAMYENNIDETRPGTREITFQVYDGSYYSNEHTIRVDIVLQNDQNPVITTSNETFVFLEHSQPLSVSENLTVSDADSGSEFQTLASITMNITNAYDGIEEELNVTEYGNVTAHCNDTCTTLVLTGPAPISDFQETLSSLTYINLAEEPTRGVRHLLLQADDGILESDIESLYVAVELVNDLPVIDLNGPASPGSSTAVNYVEGQGEVLITPNVTLTDNDHETLQMFMVRIVNAPDEESEILSISYSENITNVSMINMTSSTLDLFNISVEYNSSTNVLILSGTSNLSNYETLLQTVTYDNYEAMPGFPNTNPRMIEYIAYDGTDYSLPTLAYLTFQSVNDSAIVDLNGAVEGDHSVEFIEEGDPVLITSPDLVLMDVDNEFLAYVEVTITNVLDGDFEILTVNDSFSDESLFTTYQDGTLTITGLGLVENFHTALASVAYQNLRDEPNYTPRVITVIANDGVQDSIPQYVTVNMTAVNDPPRLFITGIFNPPPVTPPPITSGSGDLIGPGSGMSGSGDLISGSGMGLDMSGSGIDPGSSSGDQSGMGSSMSTVDSSTFGSGTTSNIDLGSGSASLSEPDGTKQQSESDYSTTDYETIDLLYTVQYLENSLPLSIVNRSEVKVEDDDDLTLTRLEIILNGVLDPGFEMIFFDINLLSLDVVSKLGEAGSITEIGDGNRCPPGLPYTDVVTSLDVMTAEGIDLLDWEEIIRSVKYCHSDEDPVAGTRNVSFRIQDPSGAWSNVVYAFIDVEVANDAPLCDIPLRHVYEIIEDENVTIPGLSRCYDYEDELTSASLVIISPSLLGYIEISSSGELMYTPYPNVFGNDTFAYVVCDSEGTCSESQNVSIAIASVNDPPYPEQNLTLVLTEDVRTLIDLSQFFGDYEDDLVPNSTYPEVRTVDEFNIGSINRNSSTAFIFEPSINFEGEGVIRLNICDSENVCISILVQVIVLPVNDVPLFETPPEGSPALRTREDTPLRIEISVFDVEDRTQLNVSFVSAQNGTGVIDPFNITFGSVERPGVHDYFIQTMYIIYTPNLNFEGTDYITISAVDSEGGYIETTFLVEVSYVNDPPEFGSTQLVILEDEITQFPLPTALQVTDPEQILHAGSFSIVQPPSMGNITYTFNTTYFDLTGSYPDEGYLTYYPPEHYFTSENETIMFVLRACDNDTLMTMLCTNSTVHITIISDNDAPHLPRVTQSVYEDSVLVFNLSDYTFDVEDGKPALDSIFLTDPYPTRGVAVYNSTTGFLHYTPYYNTYGEDVVHYNACDSENHCSTIKGQVIVSILEVNDPPLAEDFLHIAREDDFDLIGFEEHIRDNETIVTALRLGIRGEDYTDTKEYANEWTTSLGAFLRIYHAHEIITYEPPPEIVGTDSFTYSVCDLCDVRRDEELGRVDQEDQCARQIEENAGSHVFTNSDIFITCSEATVTVRITNINDVPQAKDISGTTQTRQKFTFTPFLDSLTQLPPEIGMGYLYSNPDAAIFDSDDLQALNALQRGDNLTLFNLQSTTDINETSLVLKSQPGNGLATTVINDGRVEIEYTPNDDFTGGYNEFLYEICDNQRDDEPPRCAEAVARVFVTREGPRVTAVKAHGLKVNVFGDTDSQVSVGDVITLTFSDATNMPPYGNPDRILLMSDVDEIFAFTDPFILEAVSPDGYIGQWDSPTQLNITLVDVGYPQPFVFNSVSSMYSELKVGEWTVNIRPHSGPCGGFDSDGKPVVIDQYCLLSADETAQPDNFSSPPLSGNFGLRMPELRTVLLESYGLSNIALDPTNAIDIYLQTHIILRLIEPLSYAQLQLYCSSDTVDILDTSSLAESLTMIVDGCANILPDGSSAEQVYAENIQLISDAFAETTRKRSTEGEAREKRQTQTIQPVQSEIILQIMSIENPKVNPIKDPSGFYNAIAGSLNYETIAKVIADTMGISSEALVGFKSDAQPLVSPDDAYFYYALEDDLTPEITNVVADDPDNADQVYGSGDTITITFNVDTDQPPVTSKDDLDRIFIFDPPLGTDYSGEWLNAKTLRITINAIDDATVNYPSAAVPGPVMFSLSFTPNYLHSGDPVTSDNEEYPTTIPWCIGVNVCGSTTSDGSELQSVGICDTTQRSCRAHETWTSIEGDFGTGDPEPVAPFPWWYILIAIVVIILIAVTVVVSYFMWRQHTQRAQAKEARRVLSRWKEDRGAPGKDDRKGEAPKPWQGPPAPTAMRSLPDPFAAKGPMGKLPEVVRPATAITGMYIYLPFAFHIVTMLL